MFHFLCRHLFQRIKIFAGFFEAVHDQSNCAAANFVSATVQILLERYAYSEIGGTFILIWRYAFSTQNGTFFLYYCDVTIIHHSAKEELLCTTTILFLES